MGTFFHMFPDKFKARRVLLTPEAGEVPPARAPSARVLAPRSGNPDLMVNSVGVLPPAPMVPVTDFLSVPFGANTSPGSSFGTIAPIWNAEDKISVIRDPSLVGIG